VFYLVPQDPHIVNIPSAYEFILVTAVKLNNLYVHLYLFCAVVARSLIHVFKHRTVSYTKIKVNKNISLGYVVHHPPQSGTEVEERVELYLHSPPGPSCSVIG
jgi:hypothetical protein